VLALSLPKAPRLHLSLLLFLTTCVRCGFIDTSKSIAARILPSEFPPTRLESFLVPFYDEIALRTLFHGLVHAAPMALLGMNRYTDLYVSRNPVLREE